MTGALSRSKISPVPMLDCPHCGIRQYAAASYVELPRCVECDGRLPRPEPTRRQVSGESRRPAASATSAFAR